MRDKDCFCLYDLVVVLSHHINAQNANNTDDNTKQFGFSLANLGQQMPVVLLSGR